MDGNNTKEHESSSSKKDIQKEQSGHGLNNKKRYDDSRSNSDSLSIGSYSVSSGIDLAEPNLEDSKAMTGKRGTKPPERRNRGRGGKRHGRVYKRKRSVTRRQLVRRLPKRKLRIDRNRDISVSTLFTRMSPDDRRRSRSPSCRYCGHRCCLRR